MAPSWRAATWLLSLLYFTFPVILLTGQGNEFVAVQAMKEGAQDYITKTAITITGG